MRLQLHSCGEQYGQCYERWIPILCSETSVTHEYKTLEQWIIWESTLKSIQRNYTLINFKIYYFYAITFIHTLNYVHIHMCVISDGL